MMLCFPATVTVKRRGSGAGLSGDCLGIENRKVKTEKESKRLANSHGHYCYGNGRRTVCLNCQFLVLNFP
jgi:hypothetical protein